MDTALLVRENALAEAEELAQELDRPFTDADVVSNEYGIDLRTAALHYIDTYNGKNNFMGSMKSKVLVNAQITPAMLRTALNIMRENLLGIAKQEIERERVTICRFCQLQFSSREAYDKHYDAEHNDNAPKVQAPTGEVVQEREVIAVTEGKLGLDLSQVPNGRYALPDLTGKNDYVFLMVTRQRKRIWRNKRYTYGKIITGGEWIEAGTIEVKEWSSDSKRLCGQQKPGELYKGEFEVQLKAVIAAPQPWAQLFGQQVGHCGICGKTLTDEISRSDGFGPECIRKIDSNYFTKKLAVKFERRQAPDGFNRVYCMEHSKYECDEKHSFDDEDAALL